MSLPSHRPFTLLSPTNAPASALRGHPLRTSDIPESDPSTPAQTQRMAPSRDVSPTAEDLDYPCPSLYDIVLQLNSAPDLESWWSNVASIMSECYGAERASLAIPGDITDLENVPWAQKATFNAFGSDSVGSSLRDSLAPSERSVSTHQQEPITTGRRPEANLPITREWLANPSSAKQKEKPPLETRHSFAGYPGDRSQFSSKKRPRGPVRTASEQSACGHDASVRFKVSAKGIAEETSSEEEDDQTQLRPPPQRQTTSTWETEFAPPKLMLNQTAVPLEQEPDALIMRSGIVKLFGRRRPFVLTREYYPDYNESSDEGDSQRTKGSSHHRSSGETSRLFKRDSARKIQSRPRSLKQELSHQSSSQRTAVDFGANRKSYDEYEQLEPSAWSQSPAPSPAARPDPVESPFFVATGHVDESAFAQDPPPYDYSQTQALEALGTDRSKTVIHIPLVPSSPAGPKTSNDLRFPIAIVSILSSINPYPVSLRRSLADLLPLLACTYSNAHQYSELEARSSGRRTSRYAGGFGLGGTFSDEASELELVADLSGHLPRSSESQSGWPARSYDSFSQEPSQKSPVVSRTGTPYLEQGAWGLSPQLQTPSRFGADNVDSYFLPQRTKTALTQIPSIKQPGMTSNDNQSHRRIGSDAKGQKAVVDETAIKSQAQRAVSGSQITRRARPSSKTRQSFQNQPKNGGAPDNEETGSQISNTSTASVLSNELLETSFTKQLSVASVGLGAHALPDLISQILLNSLPLQLFLAKPKTGELVWTNAKFDAYRSQGQGRVRSPWQNIHDADKRGHVREWKRALRSGSQMTTHIRVKRFDNDSDYRWFIFRASPLLSNTGHLLYWIGSFLDVHEQRLAEMKASEEKQAFARDSKYIALANSIPQILFEAVEDEGIVSANEQWPTFSGQSIEDSLGLGFAKHVHPDDLRKCGILTPQSQDDPRFQNVLKQLRRVSLNEQSRSSTDDSSKSGSSAQTLQAQPRAPFLENLAQEPALSKLVQKGVFIAEQDENKNISYSTEIRLCSKGGEYRWFLVRLVKVESSVLNNGTASWYGTCTDIHDRKHLERDLNNANAKLNQQMESKTKFFANMSHEIRTPLNGILGSIPWLIESSLDNDQRRTLDTIQNSSNNLRELVDNILDVTKVEAGKMTLVYKWFHVRQLLEEIIDTLGPRAIDKGLELNYTVDLNVPSVVKGDPFRLRQILINLTGNAVKFTEQGEIYTHCSIHVEHAPEVEDTGEHTTLMLAFDVVDTGRGFSEEDIERLFKHFSQIEGSNAQNDAGSGLGLFLSKQLVEMHGGSMKAKGRPGDGATFTFYVGVHVPSGTDHPKSPPAKAGRKRSSLGGSGSPSPVKGPEVRSGSFKSFMSLNAGPGQVTSPESLLVTSSPSSGPSTRSTYNPTEMSSFSSAIPTPESLEPELPTGRPRERSSESTAERQTFSEIAMVTGPVVKRTLSQDLSGPSVSPEALHPTTFSIVVICPAKHARAAMKQHIEQVVPHSIAANVTTLTSADEFLSLIHGLTNPVFTHIVLDLRHTHDVIHFMVQISKLDSSIPPMLIIITDHYQKRDIMEQYKTMIAAGRKVYLVTKPVKPSIFAVIFDPAQQRGLSKDRNRDTAQSATQNFKNVAEKAKHAIGGWRFRVLLVEDSDVNRMVRSSNGIPFLHADLSGDLPISEEGRVGQRSGREWAKGVGSSLCALSGLLLSYSCKWPT